MPVQPDIAEAMARLARLGLEPEPEAHQRLARDFERIVAYMDILAELDTQAVEPLWSPMVEPLGPRADEPREPDPKKTQAILDQAPESVGRFFSVPRII
ncbi:MAG: Asp-tRNA(Asn)/Glu-tRNA(Gln) amidotransferase subunit GatC [Deltaproteobacteria bacterium]|jgi:aspartyl-tRNA(Asn)/glutamyl-tRNA(Gln) amidotransferase subunit C|nr:Asp-tRNA(Asn)/Glu-tRNA(Gln) amidotransferase subunit GatC [Deltaproteobacteria bacterium]